MLHKHYIKYCCVAVLLMAIGLPFAVAFAASKKRVITEEDRVKASYVLMEAERQRNLDHNDAFHQLVKYAYSLNPENSTIAYYLGYSRINAITSTQGDSAVKAALALMRRHVDIHPEDKFEARLYASANFYLNQYDEGLRVLKVQQQLHPQDENILLSMADAYKKKGDYHKALEMYDTLQRWQGITTELTGSKMEVYQALNDTVGALSEMRSLLASAPSNVEYNLSMGKMMFMFGYRDSAMAYYDKAQQYEPNNGRTYFEKAQYYLALADTANYDRQTYLALVSPELDVESKLGLLAGYARTLLSSSSADSTHRADHLFHVLIEQHPLEPQIRVLYSEYLLAIENAPAAAEQIDYVINLDPTNQEMWIRLMSYYLYANNYAKVVEVGDKALKINPDNTDLYTFIGSSCYSTKQYDKALEVYEKALSILDSTKVNDRSNILCGMGDVKFAQADTLAAFALYDESLRLNPDNLGTLNNYAYFLALSNRDLDKAERMSAKTVQAEPSSATYLDTYAWVFYKRKEYTMAQLYIQMAISNAEEPSVELHEHYGDILLASGERQKALEQYRKALELRPGNEPLVKKIEAIANENDN